MSDDLDHMGANPNASLESEAESWLAQLDGGEMSHADRLALAEWLARSPRHERALRDAAALWRNIDLIIDERFDQPKSASIVSLLASFVSVRPLRAATIGAGAFVSLSAVVFSAFLFIEAMQSEPVINMYHVAKGDKEVITLTDGSVLHLNTNSIAEVYESDEARIVRLVRGEGFFEVEKDPARPFQVIAGDGVVEAIGTKFSVRFFNDDIAVTVSEGSVRLGAFEDKSPIGVITAPVIFQDVDADTVGTGATAQLADGEISVTALEPAAIDQKISWLDDKLVFSGDTLETVITEVARYTNQEIIISDPAIRLAKVGGVFPVGETDLLFRSLETSLGIEVVDVGDGKIYLQTAQMMEKNE